MSAVALALSDYLADANRDVLNLQNTPEMIRQVAGAAAFLRMDAVAKQLYRLVAKLENGLLEQIKTADSRELNDICNAWADVLVAADFEFENFEENRPVSKQTLLISENSLNRLLVA